MPLVVTPHVWTLPALTLAKPRTPTTAAGYGRYEAWSALAPDVGWADLLPRIADAQRLIVIAEYDKRLSRFLALYYKDALKLIVLVPRVDFCDQIYLA